MWTESHKVMVGLVEFMVYLNLRILLTPIKVFSAVIRYCGNFLNTNFKFDYH